jgi:hypothetical protein
VTTAAYCRSAHNHHYLSLVSVYNTLLDFFTKAGIELCLRVVSNRVAESVVVAASGGWRRCAFQAVPFSPAAGRLGCLLKIGIEINLDVGAVHLVKNTAMFFCS